MPQLDVPACGGYTGAVSEPEPPPPRLNVHRDLTWWRFELQPDFDGGALPLRVWIVAGLLSVVVVGVLWQTGIYLWLVLGAVLLGVFAGGLSARGRVIPVLVTERSVRVFRHFLAGPCVVVNLVDIDRIDVVEQGSGRSLVIAERGGRTRRLQTDSSQEELSWVRDFLLSRIDEA